MVRLARSAWAEMQTWLGCVIIFSFPEVPGSRLRDRAPALFMHPLLATSHGGFDLV